MAAKKQRITLLLVILLLVLVATFWFRYIEQYQKEIDTNGSDNAQRNAFYAAQLYLQKTDVDVHTTQTIENIDNFPTSDTLLVSNALRSLSPKQAEQLIAWMERGGHIVVAATPAVKNDPLLSHFKVTRKQKYKSDVEKLSEKALQEATEQLEKGAKPELSDDDCTCKDVLTTLEFEGVNEPLSIDFSDSAGLYQPYLNGDDQDLDDSNLDYAVPFYWAYDEHDALQFMQFYVGDGMLTVVASDDIWHNHAIARFDHAYLLSILSASTSQFVILRGAVMDHILLLLWRFAPELVISALALIFAWLWFLSDRLGTAVSQVKTQRRSFKEYALAHGEYLFKHGKQQRLVEKLRRQIITAIERHHFAENTASEQMLENYLQKLGWQKAEIDRLLFADVGKSEKEFLQLVKHLQAIIKKLSS